MQLRRRFGYTKCEFEHEHEAASQEFARGLESIFPVPLHPTSLNRSETSGRSADKYQEQCLPITLKLYRMYQNGGKGEFPRIEVQMKES